MTTHNRLELLRKLHTNAKETIKQIQQGKVDDHTPMLQKALDLKHSIELAYWTEQRRGLE